MKRTVARQETLVNRQATSKIKQFPHGGVSSEETKGDAPRVDKNKKLGQWLLRRREAQNLKQEDISPKVGKAQISKIEKGNLKKIQLDTLHEIATGLGTTIDEPLRIMGYLPADAVTVRGEIGRFLVNFQELPEEWRVVVSDLTTIMHRRAQKDAKRGNG